MVSTQMAALTGPGASDGGGNSAPAAVSGRDTVFAHAALVRLATLDLYTPTRSSTKEAICRQESIGVLWQCLMNPWHPSASMSTPSPLAMPPLHIHCHCPPVRLEPLVLVRLLLGSPLNKLFHASCATGPLVTKRDSCWFTHAVHMLETSLRLQHRHDLQPADVGFAVLRTATLFANTRKHIAESASSMHQ